MQPGFVPQQQQPQQFRPQLVRATFAAAPAPGRPFVVTQVPQGRPVGQYSVAGPRPVVVTQARPVGGFVQGAQVRPGQPFVPFVKGFGKGGGGFDEEDRSRDWHCPKCRERNFVKRSACFRCQAPKPADCQVGLQEQVKSGQTLNGMVKSYNRKGFGFLMTFGLGDFPDVYYTRENLSPKLETRDIPGQHVTFEILRMPDGKMIATNIRPLGEEMSAARAAAEPSTAGKGFGKMGVGCGGAFCGGGFVGAGAEPQFGPLRGREEEDRSRDWECTSCGERNFVKRLECFRCKTPRCKGFSDTAPAGSAAPAAPAHRAISPHAGSRAMAFSGRRTSGSRSPSRRSRSRRKKKKKKKDKKKKKSSSSSSGSSEKKEKRKKKDKKRRKSDSSSEASAKSVRSDSSSGVKVQEPGSAVGEEGKLENQENPEIAKAKGEALDELLALKSVEPLEARMKAWRALLRKWHPDKNQDRTEVATAVFQFLQKGKPILENK